MRLHKIACLFIAILSAYALQSQHVARVNHEENCITNYDGKNCWGPNKATAQEKFVLFSDALAMKNYQEAIAPFDWLLKNTPNLNKSIYIQGETLYKALIKNASADIKSQYQDKLLKVYDLRSQYFGETEKVMQKKGFKLYPFLAPRGKEFWNTLFPFYEKILSTSQHNTYRTNVIYFMHSLKKTHQLKPYSIDKLLTYYDQANSIINYHLAKEQGKKLEDWQKAQKTTEAIFLEIAGNQIDCDFIRQNWGNRIDSHPEDLKNIKKVIQFMIVRRCTSEPLFMKAMEQLAKADPTIKRYKLLLKDDEKLENNLLKIVELAKQENNPTEEALAYIKLGKLYHKEGKKSKARQSLLEAIKADHLQAKTAYKLLGDLYMHSRTECLAKTDPNEVKDRAFYFAAYEMYQKAGSAQGMKKAASQFPNMETIFQNGYQLGDKIQLDCWIGGTYSIKKRP